MNHIHCLASVYAPNSVPTVNWKGTVVGEKLTNGRRMGPFCYQVMVRCFRGNDGTVKQKVVRRDVPAYA